MAILEHKDLPMCYLLHPSPFLIALQKLTRPDLGVGDNCAILDFSHRHLTGHSLRNFWFCRIFFRAKLPPGTAKTVFENPKPFGCWKKNSSNQVFIKAMLWHLFSRFQNSITHHMALIKS